MLLPFTSSKSEWLISHPERLQWDMRAWLKLVSLIGVNLKLVNVRSELEKSTVEFLVKALNEDDHSKFIPNLDEILKSHSGTISELLHKHDKLEDHFSHDSCDDCKDGKALKLNNLTLKCNCPEK